jgi:AcrR family transcriptional regulator
MQISPPIVSDKRRDAVRTQARILNAAQEVFSTRGYGEARVRDITELAEVNPALVSRYFGSKLRLYEMALRAARDVRRLVGVEKHEFGTGIVRSFVDPGPDSLNPLPMMMFAAADEEARAVALRLLQEVIAEPLARWFGGQDGAERAARVLALTAGFFYYRLIYPLPPFLGELAPATRRWLEAALQVIADAPPQEAVHI